MAAHVCLWWGGYLQKNAGDIHLHPDESTWAPTFPKKRRHLVWLLRTAVKLGEDRRAPSRGRSSGASRASAWNFRSATIVAGNICRS